jgi:hypothetical protein
LTVVSTCVVTNDELRKQRTGGSVGQCWFCTWQLERERERERDQTNPKDDYKKGLKSVCYKRNTIDLK